MQVGIAHDDGSGRTQTTNGPGMDPTPGILMVASYDDRETGTRNGVVSDFSSRGGRNRSPASSTSTAWASLRARS